MPEEKKKKVIKKTNTKPLSASDIKAAAAIIPNLIARQAGLPSSKTADKLLAMSIQTAPKKKKALLWGGIGTLAVLVMFMWVWNLKDLLQSGALKHSQEGVMLQQAKTDLTNIFSGASAAPIASITANPPSNGKSGFTADADTEAKIQEGMALILATSALTSVSSTTSTAP